MIGKRTSKDCRPIYEPEGVVADVSLFVAFNRGTDPRLAAKWQGHEDAKLILSGYGKFIDRDYERAQAEKLGVSKAAAGGTPANGHKSPA